MSYQQGYAQNQYGGYQEYGQTPQTHMYQANGQAQTQYLHPMVVVPAQQPSQSLQQPRGDVSNFNATSPLLSQPQFSPDLYQQGSQFQRGTSQYHTAPQQQ